MIRERIRSGELGPRLPSYMNLAHELAVSPITVQRASVCSVMRAWLSPTPPRHVRHPGDQRGQG